jgi:excisionase family DNA binding protein
VEPISVRNQPSLVRDAHPEPRSPKLLTVAQVAERLSVSERNVRHQIFQRRIGIVKIGRLVRIDERQLEEFIDEGRISRGDFAHL